MGEGRGPKRCAMACCGAPPKARRNEAADGDGGGSSGLGKAAGGGGSAEAAKIESVRPGPLVFQTHHGELRFEEGGAVVVREESASQPSSPGESSPGGSSAGSAAKGPGGGTGSKLGAKRARPGPPGGAGNRYRMATCNGETDVLHTGSHFAEFTLVKATGNVTLGVVQLGYSPTRALPPGEPRGPGAEGWGLSTRSGWLTFRGKVSEWAGCQPCKEGDTVGMLVDLEKGTLSVFLNSKHIGFMVKAGITGPLMWMTELNTPGDAVKVSS